VRPLAGPDRAVAAAEAGGDAVARLLAGDDDGAGARLDAIDRRAAAATPTNAAGTAAA
jgi:hypothetical protein